jgi:hypothetical protein
MMTRALPKGPSPIKTSLVSPIFADGRVVSAEDLHLAMSYPLDVFRVMMRAFFGCGIVCGLDLEPDPRLEKLQKEDRVSHTVRILPGVALDCHGHPIQLCRPVSVDLSPDPCDCGEGPKRVCLAIKRSTSEEQPRADDPCGCPTEPSRFACSRLQDRVEIKIYHPDEPPRELCWHAPGKGRTPGCCDEQEDEERELVDPDRAAVCQCLATCGCCECCGDSWVYLGCVEIGEKEVTPSGLRWRRYVKPIDCLCRKVPKEKEEEPEDEQTYPKEDEAEPRRGRSRRSKSAA